MAEYSYELKEKKVPKGVDRRYDPNPEYHIGIAKRITKKFAIFGTPWYEEVFADALLGLVEASERYGSTKGSFITYAHYWIKAKIFDGFEKQRPFSGGMDSFYNNRNFTELNTSEGREAYAEKLGITLGAVDRIYLASITPLSLDGFVSGDGKLTNLYDMVADDSLEDPIKYLKLSYEQIKGCLTEREHEREQEVIRLRYFEELTLEEVSQYLFNKKMEELKTLEEASQIESKEQTLEKTSKYFFNKETEKPLTAERVRQIEVGVIKKLRRAVTRDTREDLKTLLANLQ